jgi:tetratricopeptide (TPR) repeat protein
MTKKILCWIELAVFIIIFIFIFGLTSYERNFVWNDEFSLWSDVIKKSPNKYRAYNEIGRWYLKKLLIDNAIYALTKSITLNPNADIAHNNLGYSFMAKGLIDPAIEEFKQAIRVDPSNGIYHINLGIAYSLKGLNDLAYKEIQIGKELRIKEKKQSYYHPNLNELKNFKQSD